MPFDSGREEFTDFQKRILALIECGATLAAARIAESRQNDLPGEDCADTLASKLQHRIIAGEDTLQALGLCPAVPDGDVRPPARSGLILLRAENAQRVVVIFNGNTAKFALPHPFVHDEQTHILLIRDPSRCFGFLGIPELGVNYETCLANLQRIIHALDAEKVFCVGMSAGGSAALKYGCDLKVEGILGFSVPTTLDLKDDPGAELRRYPQLTNLYRQARHLGIDLGAYYKSVLPRPGVMLVYSEGHTRDAWLARRMEGIAGVQNIPLIEFSGHKTYRWLQSSGHLKTLINQMFGLSRVAST